MEIYYILKDLDSEPSFPEYIKEKGSSINLTENIHDAYKFKDEKEIDQHYSNVGDWNKYDYELLTIVKADQ